MRLHHAISLQDTARLLGGTLIHGGGTFVSVTVDSRRAEKDALFFALSGNNCDGSLFLREAAAAGSVAAVVSRLHAERARAVSFPCILVDDPLSALWLFAKSRIERCSHITCVGVTGSCGKTTTKDAIASILSVSGKTAKTPENLNSEIGLPLSVMQVEDDTRYGVFEMGVDHECEMAHMLSVVQPDVSVLTNIGISHLEHFGSRENIAHEKGQIFHPTVKAGFIGKGSPYLRQIERERQLLLREYSRDELYAVDRGLSGYDLYLAGRFVHVNVVGRHMLTDLSGAISVARFLGIDEDAIATGLEGFTPSEGRSTIIDGKVTIIEDCYNASPDSTCSILDYLSQLPWRGKKKAVLGTMKELGSESVEAHQWVARKVLSSGLSDTFLFGGEMKSAYDLLKKDGYDGRLAFTDDFEELKEDVTSSVQSGDLLLVKGSRAMAMERLIPAIRNAG